ncbi:hypothetical protein C0992_000508 [Termitomyces sp. T32_za158]|nr:hypothetical protein C0992_000508 [Termitomyces sp. T32_za158]
MVHYPHAIQHFGTTDSYSTQIGEMEHKRVKAFYIRTNKNQFEGQIALQERRQARSRAMKDIVEEEVLPPTNPEEHHYISKTRQSSINLLQWAKDYQDDPAIKVCIILIILGYKY